MRRSLFASVLVFAACASGGAATTPAGPPTAAGASAAKTAPAAAATPGAGEASPALGQEPASAIEVCMPRGERAYLSTLRCADGSTPAFERRGSTSGKSHPKGERPADDGGCPARCYDLDDGSHITDRYVVACPGAEHRLYFDMYHCDQPSESRAPPGFTRATPDAGAR